MCGEGRGGEGGRKKKVYLWERERGAAMGQVLAVQELLYLQCLHDQAAKTFDSSKIAVHGCTSHKHPGPK